MPGPGRRGRVGSLSVFYHTYPAGISDSIDAFYGFWLSDKPARQING